MFIYILTVICTSRKSIKLFRYARLPIRLSSSYSFLRKVKIEVNNREYVLVRQSDFAAMHDTAAGSQMQFRHRLSIALRRRTDVRKYVSTYIRTYGRILAICSATRANSPSSNALTPRTSLTTSEARDSSLETSPIRARVVSLNDPSVRESIIRVLVSLSAFRIEIMILGLFARRLNNRPLPPPGHFFLRDVRGVATRRTRRCAV